MDDTWSDDPGRPDPEPGHPRAEHAAFVLLGALAAILALSRMFAFL